MLSWTCLPMSLSSSFLRVLAGGEREGDLTLVFFHARMIYFFSCHIVGLMSGFRGA